MLDHAMPFSSAFYRELDLNCQGLNFCSALTQICHEQLECTYDGLHGRLKLSA